MPTSLKPFISNLLMISPMMPLCTPSGLMAMNVRSFRSAMTLKHSTEQKQGIKSKSKRARCGRTSLKSHSRRLLAFGTVRGGAGCRGPRPHCTEAHRQRVSMDVMSEQSNRTPDTDWQPHPQTKPPYPQTVSMLHTQSKLRSETKKHIELEMLHEVVKYNP